jgi:hypothetical protein
VSNFIDAKIQNVVSATKASAPDSDLLQTLCQQLMLTGAQWALQRPIWSVVVLELVKQTIVLVPTIRKGISSSIHGFFTELLGTGPQDLNQTMTEGGSQSPESQKVAAAAFGLADLITGTPLNMRSLLKSAAAFGRDLNGLRQGTIAAHELVKWIVELIQMRVIRRLQLQWLRIEPTKTFDYAQFVEDVDSFLSADIVTMCHPDGIKEMKRLMLQRNEISQLLFKDKSILSTDRNRIVADAQRRIYECYRTNLVKFSEVYNAMRPCPFVINLDGEPGVGKSSILSAVINAVMSYDMCGKHFDMDNLIYTRSKTSFWDGFNQQPAIIYDEPWQGRSSSTTESTALEFIDLVSEVPMRLNMASLMEKGINAMPELVAITSNDPYPSFTEVRCKEAVWRRRNAMIRVQLYPDVKFPNSKKPRNGYILMNPLKVTAIEPDFYDRDQVLNYEEMIVVVAGMFRSWIASAHERSTSKVTHEQLSNMLQSTSAQHDRLMRLVRDAGCMAPEFPTPEPTPEPVPVPVPRPRTTFGTDVPLMPSAVEMPVTEGLCFAPPVPSVVSYYAHQQDPTRSLYTTESVLCADIRHAPRGTKG